MYLNLCCRISIGSLILKAVNEVTIKSSWRNLTDSATITLPRNITFKSNHALEGERLEKYIKRGDKVIIELGYNNNYSTEFEGYVREVEPNVPTRIYCEDEMVKLKKGNFKRVWKKAKLQDIIKEIVPGYNYQVVDATLDYSSISGKTAAQILLDLREFGIYSYFKRIDGTLTLYSGFPYSFQFNRHTYHMQKNVRDNDLKFRHAVNVSDPSEVPTIQVKAIANLPTGKKTIEYFPSQEESRNAEIITLNYSELSANEAERKKILRQYAEAEFKKYNVNGYRGSITGFAVPVPRHGDHVKIVDARYPEREGTYIIDETLVEFGEVYLKRKSELGPKVS
jgi:hypothetical protein